MLPASFKPKNSPKAAGALRCETLRKEAEAATGRDVLAFLCVFLLGRAAPRLPSGGDFFEEGSETRKTIEAAGPSRWELGGYIYFSAFLSRKPSTVP